MDLLSKQIRVVDDVESVDDWNIASRNVVHDGVSNLQTTKTVIDEKHIASPVCRKHGSPSG